MLDWFETAGDFLMGTAISTLSVVGLGPDEPTRYQMDGFLAGLTQGCQISSDLGVFWEQIVADGALIVPADAGKYFSSAQIAVREDHRELRVPVQGVWMGHDVAAISVIAGIDNGYSSIGVIFAAGQEGLDSGFAPLAGHSDAIMKADPDNLVGASAVYGTFGGAQQYICDFSN
ncbi:hypothetical protein [Pelagibacterium sp.]|uniref:hypothetical protein n=1 Tax=Pelagibacterium sp. TaxID=1967288 RepID=UPI003A950E98